MIAFTLLAFLLTGCGAGQDSAPTQAPSETPRPQGTAGLWIGPITNPIFVPSGSLIAPSAMPVLPSLTSGQNATVPPNSTASATYGPVAMIGTATFTPTITLPVTTAPTLPPIATAAGPTAAFGPVVAPNYTPPPTLTPMPALPPGGTLPPPFTPGPSPTPGGVLRRNMMGIQMHGDLTEAEFNQMLDRAAELGVGWVKIQVSWKLYEPEPGKYTQVYQGQVLNIQRASTRGFRVLLGVAQAPDWARPENVRGVEDGPPDSPAALASFVARLVRDVKPEFIDAIEVWNEPNLIREWRGKPIGGSEYMRYFRAAYDAIQREQLAAPSALKPNHRIIVITAGPAPTVTFTGSTIGDREWIQQLYEEGLSGMGDDVVIGAHPYGWGNPPEARCCQAADGVTGWFEHPSFYFRETLDAYRDIMTRRGDSSRKLWVTEFGWATYDGLKRPDGQAAVANESVGWQKLIDQSQQAAYIVRAFQLAQQPPYFDFVGPLMLWNLNYSMVPGMLENGGEQAGFSLLDGNGQPRPAFVALREAPKQ